MPKIAALNQMLSYLAYRVFKPLVVLFLRNSVPFQTASDWLKRIYVDVAFENKEFRINTEKKQTKTRVAVLTGLSRVEIDRVLKTEKPIELTEQKWNRATKVLSAWCADERYLDENNLPLDLPIYGKGVTFSSLVNQYSGGATMRSILDELVNVKSVGITGDVVKLLRRDYAIVPSKQKIVDLELYGMFSGNLLDSISYNDNEQNIKEKRYVKMVLNRTISMSKRRKIQEIIKSESDKLLNNIDLELTKTSSNKGNEETYEVGLGVYYFEEKNNEE